MGDFTQPNEGVNKEYIDLGGGAFTQRPDSNFVGTGGSNYASADNAIATATIAARGAGLRAIVTQIIGGFSNNTTVGTVTVKRGTTTVFVLPFTGNFNINLHIVPLKGNENEAVTAAISASGAGGVIGHVALLGFAPGA
jgi:hypothetical protein